VRGGGGAPAVSDHEHLLVVLVRPVQDLAIAWIRSTGTWSMIDF
jgi:hypothetical protein